MVEIDNNLLHVIINVYWWLFSVQLLKNNKRSRQAEIRTILDDNYVL